MCLRFSVSFTSGQTDVSKPVGQLILIYFLFCFFCMYIPVYLFPCCQREGETDLK